MRCSKSLSRLDKTGSGEEASYEKQSEEGASCYWEGDRQTSCPFPHNF